MIKKSLTERVETLERRLRNTGCTHCKWYSGDSYASFKCHNKKFREYRSGGALKDYFVDGDIFELNGNRDCSEFKKIKRLRWF